MGRWSALVSACLIGALGCTSGSYETAEQQSLERYRMDGEMQPRPKEFAGGRLQLRVPRLFTNEKAPKPPFLKDLPGFVAALEVLLSVAEPNGEKMPAGLSIWALADDASAIEDVKNRIATMVKAQKDPAFATATWANVDGPPGGPASWAVMTLEGQQPFDRLSAGEKGGRDSKSTPGKTQIWAAADAASKICAVLVWRVPEELAAQVSLNELAPIVARTVTMKPAAEPAQDATAPAKDPPAAGGDAAAAKKP